MAVRREDGVDLHEAQPSVDSAGNAAVHRSAQNRIVEESVSVAYYLHENPQFSQSSK